MYIVWYIVAAVSLLYCRLFWQKYFFFFLISKTDIVIFCLLEGHHWIEHWKAVLHITETLAWSAQLKYIKRLTYPNLLLSMVNDPCHHSILWSKKSATTYSWELLLGQGELVPQCYALSTNVFVKYNLLSTLYNILIFDINRWLSLYW